MKTAYIDRVKIDHGEAASYFVVMEIDGMPLTSLPMTLDQAVAMHWKILTGKEMP